MGINIRQKGQGGEREVADIFNTVINRVLVKHGIPIPTKPVVQRNQNQSAVGGSDLSNTFGLSVEVKRQEALSVNSWWKQCVQSAKETGEVPILVYRQNSRKWQVVMNVALLFPFAENTNMLCRATIDWVDFLQWFEHWVDLKIQLGEMPKQR